MAFRLLLREVLVECKFGLGFRLGFEFGLVLGVGLGQGYYLSTAKTCSRWFDGKPRYLQPESQSWSASLISKSNKAMCIIELINPKKIWYSY